MAARERKVSRLHTKKDRPKAARISERFGEEPGLATGFFKRAGRDVGNVGRGRFGPWGDRN